MDDAYRFHSLLVDFENSHHVLESEELVQTRELVLNSVKLSKFSLRFNDNISERSYIKWRRKRRQTATLLLCFFTFLILINDIFDFFASITIDSLLKLILCTVALLMLITICGCLKYHKNQRFYLEYFVYSSMMLRVTISVGLNSNYTSQKVPHELIFDAGMTLISGPLAFGVLLDIPPLIVLCFQFILSGVYASFMTSLRVNKEGDSHLDHLQLVIGVAILSAAIGYFYLHNDRMSFVTKVVLLDQERKRAREKNHHEQESLVHKKLLETKSKYIAQVAHDFGTPITTLSLSFEMLQNTLEEKNEDGEIKNILETCECAVELMKLTREEALDHAKQILGMEMSPDIKETQLISVLLRCDRMTSIMSLDNLHQFDFFLDSKLSPSIMTDDSWIWSMTVNFLSNAKKYSHSGRIVTTIFESECDHMFQVEVSDEGIGVPSDLHHLLFKPFSQLMHSAGGTGLGLHGVCVKANALKGTVSMRENPLSPTGSIFSFQLPLVFAFDDRYGSSILQASSSHQEGGVLFLGAWPDGLIQEVCEFLLQRFSFVEVVETIDLFLMTKTLQEKTYSLIFWYYGRLSLKKTMLSIHKEVANIQKLWAKQCAIGAGPIIYINFPDETHTMGEQALDTCDSSENLEKTQAYSVQVPHASAQRYQRSMSGNSNRFFGTLSENARPDHKIHAEGFWEQNTCISVRSDHIDSLEQSTTSFAVKNKCFSKQKHIKQLLTGFTIFINKPITPLDIKSLAVQVQTSRITSSKSRMKIPKKIDAACEQTNLHNTVDVPMKAQSVLLVEDEPSILKFTSRMLEKHGFVVTTRGNGFVGLQELQKRMFGVAIIDMNMPVMDGLECVRRFREWEEERLKSGKRDSTQFIIVLSGDGSKRKEVICAGADTFLLKPTRTAELVSIIQSGKP